LKRECERFGIGLLTFSDPGDWDTFDVVVEADHKLPDPDEVDNFIRLQVMKANQEVLQELIR
jgi:hypothetical protein